MSRKGLCATIVSVCAVSAAFLLFAPRADAAFSACQCDCVDPNTTNDLLHSPPGANAAEHEAICTEECGNINLPLFDWAVQVAENRLICSCQNTEPIVKYQKLTPGRSDCSADCSQACGGAAFVDQTQDQSTNIRQVDCIRADDCTVGDFQYFKDVSCTTFPSTNPLFPDGEPRCVIPPTRENADIECQQEGGIAAGGNAKCIFISRGENINANFITRTYLTGTGQYIADAYNTYTSVEQLWSALDASGLALEQPGGNQPGLCYLYGKSIGFDYSQIDIGAFVGNLGAEIGEDVFGVGSGAETPEGSRRYICAKPKTNSCGVFAAPDGTNPIIKTRTSYSCVPESQVTNPTEQCFPNSWSGNLPDGTPVESDDLCITPGTLCCAGLQGCTSDAECGPYKQCIEGDCEWRTVCDPVNTDRRCRRAEPAERVNPDVCTLGIGQASGLSMAQEPCPVADQYCCEAPDPAALSSCAVDLDDNDQFARAGDGNDWRDYLCVPTVDIPDFGGAAGEWVTLPDGSRRLKSWQTGGNCVTSDVPAGGEVGGAAISRCGTGRACCDIEAIGLQERVAELNERPEEGFDCASSMTCKDPDNLVASWQLSQRGFPSIYSYLDALSGSGYCRVTPLASGSYTINEECQNGLVCCNNNVIGGNFCVNDDTCPAGERCDKYVKLCVPGEIIDQKLASDGCVDLAEAQNGITDGAVVVEASGVPREEFSCQFVPADSLEAKTYCLAGGCDAQKAQLSGQLPEGKAMLCCAKGIGESPGAAAQTIHATPDITPGAGSIGLPSCIKTGKCTLDDIVKTGANFANFLIGISGSVFLAIFVYAGFMYLTAGGSGRAETARKMLVQSTIGIVLMLAGFVIISFIQSAIISTSSGGTAVVECGRTEETQGMSCTLLQADSNDDKAVSEEISGRGCVRGLCPGPTNYVCCPS